MAWQFGDGFDLYAAPADMVTGYWDSGVTVNWSFAGGRFAGSQSLHFSTSTSTLIKSSGANDALHHFVCALRQPGTITGTTLVAYLQLSDGATAQCTVCFRSDGAIVLTSGGPAGSALATYTGAFPVTNTWYAFEIEVFISATAGYMNVRKNGNTVNDFASATNLNTRAGTANNYANRLQVGQQGSISGGQDMDDLYWRSDASSVPWMGDIRCFTRMPANDQSVQFSRTPTTVAQTPFTFSAFQGTSSTVSFYMPFTAARDGTVGSITVPINAGFTGNLKCTVFNDAAGVPGTIRSSATTITNPPTGTSTFTFSTPFAVTNGTLYWVGLMADGSYTNALNGASANTGRFSSSVSYAAFPTATPTTTLTNAILCSVIITLAGNYQVVSEAQQDATTSYVYDSTVNDQDFYGIAAIASTPVATIAVTTRAYMEKSDAGTRTAAVQLKSGSATVASPTLVLTTSGWQWAWRTDTVDPNTSAAWTAASVNNCNIGPRVIA